MRPSARFPGSRFLGLLVLCFLAACGDDGSGSGDNNDNPNDNPSGIDAGAENGSCLGCEDFAGRSCCEIGGQSYCVSTADDFFHCGGCGMGCDENTADSCGGSSCKCGAGAECFGGQTCCGSPTGCKDLMNDPQN